jgi:hypothetical protein
VVWDFAGEPFPPDLVSALSIFLADLTGSNHLSAILAAYLSPQELAALCSRAEALLAVGQYPFPPEDRRAFPYPPV